ncbi:lipid A core-O-antigen ligase-like enyme [Desulfosporosinus acidiphilus SJ4]|uniref:Lipid A core-O-antigen ligase-like enyme n=1 Tax=Desulfosporosinus acidiphilus (strain DSM 22704 / JCM 16185 / SJ4) TaxID=646529 RepID=I4D956_DESAJ|nr:O-antigen ligase family protein [Desulfosporosinus acidiphilus]AFM42330.1 lipid A core-O-antigen ligase-like enyme [Desulfosporosinus acidiphilus SJ4]
MEYQIQNNHLKKRFGLRVWLQLGIGIVLFLSPFFRGLYFNDDCFNFLIIIGIISGVTALRRFFSRESFPFSLNLMDLGFTGLALWYLVCIPSAASIGDAILAAMRILGYLSLYYASVQLLTKDAIKVGVWIFALTGALVTCVGIGSSIGLPQVAGSWGAILSSTFQYHNALGGYMLMVIPVCILLFREAKPGWQRYLAASLLYLNLLGLVASQSRGAYVLFLPVLLLVLLSFRKKDRFLLMLLALGLWGAVDNWTQIAWAGNMKSLSVLVWPCIGLMGIWFIVWLEQGIRGRVPGREIRTAGIIVILGILVLGTLPLIAPAWGEGRGSNTIVTKIQSIDPQDHNLQERFAFYHDALKMVRERPIFGFGGNGWVVAYKGYQSYLYSSKETHDEPIKILVEAGIPGLLFYSLIWLGFLRRWLKTWRERANDWNYLLGISVIGIFLHSLMDFDLSESAIFFAMVILMAVLGCDEKNEDLALSVEQETHGKKLVSQNFRYSPKFVRGVTALMILLGAALVSGSINMKEGTRQAALAADSLRAGSYIATIQESQTALNYFPFQSSVYANLAQAELAEGSADHNQGLIRLAAQHVQQATSLNSTDPTLRSAAARVYSFTGYPERAYQEAIKCQELSYLYSQGYEERAQYALDYAEQLLENGNKQEAVQVLEQVQSLPGQINTRFAQRTDQQQRMRRSGPMVAVTPRLWIYHAEALSLLGQRTLAINELEMIRFDREYGCAALLLEGIIKEQGGNKAEGSRDIHLAVQSQPQLKSSEGKLRKLIGIGLLS